jgi:hypothetical protein
VNAGVNTPKHAWPLYKYFISKYPSPKNISTKSLNFNGLACNCTHYIDYVSRWVNSEVEVFDLTGGKEKWISSKRSGFFEIEDKIFIIF